MRLRIRNFAKVKDADIILDGITVIAGRNNTGKSTVGKVLDSMYNSANDLEGKMRSARKSRLQNSLLKIIDNALFFPNMSHSTIAEIAERMLEAESRSEETIVLNELMSSLLLKNSGLNSDELMEMLRNTVDEIKAIPDGLFIRAILSNYFEETFNGNINSVFLSQTESDAEVYIEIKSGRNTVHFWNDTCIDFEFGYKPMNSSYYLDNPMLMDKLNNKDVIRNPRQYLSEQEYHLYTKLIGEKSSVEDRALNEIINREKLDEVMGLLNQVIPGEIIYNQKYEYRAEKGVSGIDIRSLSTGVKSFAILKQLILNGGLNDRDAIVLDEPEIHLHPEWQMIYAELIVVLQEKFDLNFIINTHSSHFLETLDFYAAKYERRDMCHYYLSEESEGVCCFEEVTDTPERIYKQLVDPSLLLAREKEIWEDEHGSV